MKENIQKIKEKVVAAVPEIMELKFGTPVKIKVKDDWFKDTEKIYHAGFRDEASVQESWSILETFQAGFHPSCFEILGRPIRLADVLVAIGETEHRMICDASRQFKGLD